MPLSGPQADIAGSEYRWLMLTSNKDEVITFADSTSTEQPSLATTCLLAGPPSKVLNLAAMGGDASAIVSWGLPDSNGSMAMLDGYDVEVSDTGGSVVKTLDAKEPWIAVTGLGDGVTYTIKVRAKTAFGQSDWESTTATTKAVPRLTEMVAPYAPPNLDMPPSATAKVTAATDSGAQEYVDRVKAYYQAQDAVLEGRANTIWDAPGVTADAPNTAKLSLLNAALVEEFTSGREVGKTRTASTVTLDNAVVQGQADGVVRVTVGIKRAWQTLYSAEQVGSSSNAVKTGDMIPGSSYTVAVVVFDACGNMSIIDVPIDQYEDPTDEIDPEGSGGGSNADHSEQE